MIISESTLKKAIDYKAYRETIDTLFKEGKVTGPEQNQDLLDYTKLNISRMNRVDKTSLISDDMRETLSKIKSPLIWLVLAEGWCGDAAQIVPYFNTIALSSNNKIDLKFLFRDENLDLMDQFLTNGARSIPKLIIVDAASKQVIGQWGPRPFEAQDLINKLKEQGIEMDNIKEKLHRWYADNKNAALDKELTDVLKEAISDIIKA